MKQLAAKKTFAESVLAFATSFSLEKDSALASKVSLGRLCTDDRMAGVWQKLNGDRTVIEGYLDCVHHALLYCVHPDEFEAECEKRRAKWLRLITAIREIVSYCEGPLQDGPVEDFADVAELEFFEEFGEEIEFDFVATLRELAPKVRTLEDFVAFQSEIDAEFDAHFRLLSREKKIESRLATHFAYLMITFPPLTFPGGERLLTLQDVADTMNALFNWWDEDAVSADSVRKASARHKLRMEKDFLAHAELLKRARKRGKPTL